MHFLKKHPHSRQVGRRKIFLFLALLSAFALNGCHTKPDSAKDIAIACQITPSPPKIGLAHILVQLIDKANGKPERNAAISLEGDMSHAGMTPVFGTAQEVEAGHYQGTLHFTMAGDWVILVKATLPNHHTVERQVAVNNVEAN